MAGAASATFNKAVLKNTYCLPVRVGFTNVTFRYHKQLKTKEHTALGRKSYSAPCP